MRLSALKVLLGVIHLVPEVYQGLGFASNRSVYTNSYSIDLPALLNGFTKTGVLKRFRENGVNPLDE